ncbi:MAG: LamG domain-containing protein [Candidatus Aenigmatarchaeota archaeon]
MDFSFIVATGLFLIFISLILVSAINYFIRTPESATILELRGKSKELFDIFFGSGGIVTNERVTTDLYRIPLILEERNGTARTNEAVSLSVEFHDLCDSPISWNNTVRVYDQNFLELMSRISYQEFCTSQWLNTSQVTFIVNMSANERKIVYAYAINNTNTTPPNHNTTLKGYWKFDETSGTLARDSSGWENNGTTINGTDRCANNNCPVWATGIYANAIQLDGINDYVNASDSASINLTWNVLTFSVWVNFNGTASTGTTQRIISKTAGSGSEQYELLYTSDSFTNTPNRFRFDIRNSTALVSLYTNETFASTNTWYHVAGVYNSTHVIIFVNGREKNSSVHTGAIAGRASDVNIGRLATGGENFNGTIDEVRIYNESLSDSRITNLAIRSNQILTVRELPSETISAISASNVQGLSTRNYPELKSLFGGDYDFRIEIREKR